MTYFALRMKHLLVFFTILLAVPAFAQVPPSPMPPTLSITGEAKETVMPDQAILTASVVNHDKQLAVAKKNNDDQMEKVVKIAQEFNIPRSKITPSNLNINPEYIYNDKTRKQEMTGYVVSRTLRITMDKLDIHERVLSALVDANVDQVSGVEFSVANPDAISDRLRVKAMENAKTKATALAAAAGVKLGKPLSINAGGGYVPPMPIPMARMAMMDSGGAEKTSVAPSLPGMLDMRESVSVVFALE